MFENMMPGMDKMAEYNKQWMASFAQASEIAADAQRKLANQQMAAFEGQLNAATRLMDAVIEGKKPAELYAMQVEMTQALGEEMMGYAKDAWELQVETRDKLAKLVSESADIVPFTAAMKPAGTARAKRTEKAAAA